MYITKMYPIVARVIAAAFRTSSSPADTGGVDPAQRQSRAFLRAAQSINFKLLIPCVALVLACLPVERAQAKAHCFCKLGPVGAPFHDFGEVDTYATQIGRDEICRKTCNDQVSSYMSDPARKATVCAAAKGGNVVSYSAVGTRSYIAGNSLACPASTGGAAGSLVFNTIPGVTSPWIRINGVDVNRFAPPQSIQVVNVPISGAHTLFEMNDFLQLHAQSWTYDATLYRDGVKIERFSKKSPVGYHGNVMVRFTAQPNSFVHGHDWKVEWHYAGRADNLNGSVRFRIP